MGVCGAHWQGSWFLNQLSWPEEWESTKEVVGSLCNCAVLQAIDGRKAKDQDMTRLPRATDTYLHTSQGACARQEDRLDISALEGVVQKRGVS